MRASGSGRQPSSHVSPFAATTVAFRFCVQFSSWPGRHSQFSFLAESLLAVSVAASVGWDEGRGCAAGAGAAGGKTFGAVLQATSTLGSNRSNTRLNMGKPPLDAFLIRATFQPSWRSVVLLARRTSIGRPP